MSIGLRMSGGFMSVLCLGILLGAMIIPLQAGARSVQLGNGESVPSGSMQTGVLHAGRPLYSPAGLMDRRTPISERPFAKPFIDRSSPISERPLAPIGGGVQVAPNAVPFIRCQGQWVRADSPWHSCPSR
jgi:hypothetical protein